VALATLACVVEQPVIPRAGVPTLDDAATSHGFTAVSAGFEHTCALTSAGSAHCWGSDEYGQLGTGTPATTTCARDDRSIACRTRPATVAGNLQFQKIAAGGRITCGLTVAGTIHCWGDNLHGGLGDPAYRASDVPVPIAATGIFTDVAAGGRHACGIRSDGVVLCWGYNESGQIGSLSAGTGSAVPAPVNTQLRFVSIAAGDKRTCARQADGAAYCWGSFWVNSGGGLEVIRPQVTPQRVQSPSLPLFSAIVVGTNTTCALAPDNSAHCWEANPAGGIGDGTAAGSLVPRPVSGRLRFVALSAGALHSCGITDAGSAFCWGGAARGQLGLSFVFLTSRCGPTNQACSTVPIRVSGWRLFTQISAGQGDHSCALTLAGNVFCWGAGGMGQRGDGRSIDADWLPVRTLAP
jgi:alpha-tubulin suppressor-like RCC1 family protein